jgi:hypothetical protein
MDSDTAATGLCLPATQRSRCFLWMVGPDLISTNLTFASWIEKYQKTLNKLNMFLNRMCTNRVRAKSTSPSTSSTEYEGMTRPRLWTKPPATEVRAIPVIPEVQHHVQAVDLQRRALQDAMWGVTSWCHDEHMTNTWTMTQNDTCHVTHSAKGQPQKATNMKSTEDTLKNVCNMLCIPCWHIRNEVRLCLLLCKACRASLSRSLVYYDLILYQIIYLIRPAWTLLDVLHHNGCEAITLCSKHQEATECVQIVVLQELCESHVDLL